MTRDRHGQDHRRLDARLLVGPSVGWAWNLFVRGELHDIASKEPFDGPREPFVCRNGTCQALDAASGPAHILGLHPARIHSRERASIQFEHLTDFAQAVRDRPVDLFGQDVDEAAREIGNEPF
jgi:hypothetical protein